MAFSSRSCFVFSFNIFGIHKSFRKFENLDISDCSGCKLAKFFALPFNQSISVSSSPFDLIHSDVWGPSSIATKGGS